MKPVRIEFTKDLYDPRAVRDAAEAFGGLARIDVTEKGGACTMTLRPGAGWAEDDGKVVGEIVNFVLARTVELRAG